MLCFALLALTASPVSDPCSLRALVDKSSAELAPLVAKSLGREHACLAVVEANALSREGHGSDAVKLYDEAAAELADIASFLDLAKKRALAPPPNPDASPSWAKPPSSPDEAAERVQALLRRAQPKRAVEVALAFPRAGDPSTVPNEPLEVATITALARANRIDDAIARAAKLPPTDAFVKVHAWALAKAGKYREARDFYAQLASTTADPALKAEASFYAGFSAYEGDDLDDAKSRFVAGADAMKGSPFEAFGRWYTALADLLRGKNADAVPVLENLVKDLPSDKEALKHRYWLGRALLDSGKAAQGKKVLGDVADLEPTDYYGLLARKRLGKKPLKGAAVAADALIKTARADDDAKRVRLLWGIGLDDEARALAHSLGEGAPEIGLQQSIDDATYGWRRGARFIPVPRAKGGALVNDARWRVSYASPWPALVDAAAKKHGISPAFVYAIMRTESGFDPRAVSVAGAQGVIQLLPSAARGSCKLADRSLDDAKRIFDPAVAVDLGAALLAAGKREFGSDALSAAAYNGAAPNVAQWMKEYRSLETELFIERIPFRETRDYVKRVMAVEATYRALDGQPLAIELPSSIPEPPSTFTHFPMDE